MVKRISALVFAIFSSVLLLWGCGDPYKDFKLTVSTSDVVLYLSPTATEGETTESTVDTSLYPPSTDFTVKVDGTNKNIGGEVTITQYALNGVEDIVKVDMISNDTTAKDGAKYRLTALKPGRGVVIVTTDEGNKRHEIAVTVYVPVQSVGFVQQNLAIRYGGTFDLSTIVSHTPKNTNQKEMTFYLEDPLNGNVTKDEKGGIIETPYASIQNGIITTKAVSGYPVNSAGNRYVKVYGVSNYNDKLVTETISLPVLDIIDESEIDLQTITELGYTALVKNNLGYYDLVLGGNIPTNPYVYSRNLTIKLDPLYSVDNLYSISTNYKFDADSVFELDTLVDEQSRYDYVGINDLYPYKSYDFNQIKTGTQVLEIYIDRRGYEGLFTTTLKIRVIVKDFPTELTAKGEDGQDAIANGLVLYNAYGGSTLGTSVQLAIAPNQDGKYKIKVNLKDCPIVDNRVGITMSLANSVQVFSDDQIDSGTKLFLKHTYDYETIKTQITETGLVPKLVVSYTYNTAPAGVESVYQDYIFSYEIPLTLKTAVSDIRIPSENSEIKINAVTGRATIDGVPVEAASENKYVAGIYAEEEEEKIPEIVLATVDDQPVDLYDLISSIKTLSVDGMASDLDPMSNKFFDISFKEGEYVGMKNRLVLEPKLQAEQVRIVVEIKTNNNITKSVIIDVFVPVVYVETFPEQVNLEIYNESDVSSDIYESTRTNFKVIYKDKLEIVDEYFEPNEDEAATIVDTAVYTSLDSLTLATNSEIGLNVYNYIVLKNSAGEPKINKVLYNKNVVITQNREYYTITNKTVNGVTIPFLATKKLKTEGQLGVDIKISGYDNNGKLVEFTKVMYLTIIEPITSVSLYPKNKELYIANSLGALKVDESKAQLKLNIVPVNASGKDGVQVKYSYSNDVLYSLVTDVYYVDKFDNIMTLDGSGNFLGMSTADITFDGTNPEVKIENVVYRDLTGYFYLSGGERVVFKKDQQKDFSIKVEHFLTLDEETGQVQAIVDSAAINEILNEYKNETGATVDTSQIINNIFSKNVTVSVYGSLQQYNKPPISDSTNIILKYAQKVEKIIPSTSDTGIYFDTRKQNDGETITFNILPATAKNKTLIISIINESVAHIVSGVDKNNRMTGSSIVVKPTASGGRTYMRIAAEDSYEIDSKTGIAVPTSYIDISIRVANGTKDYPFEIGNPQEFMEIGEDIAAGNNKFYYTLRESFSMVSVDFAPFKEFNGGLTGKFTYDVAGVNYSQQNTIYDFCYNISSDLTANNDYNFGLFSILGEKAEITDLLFSGANINLELNNSSFAKTVNVGVIAGTNRGLIKDSSVYGKMTVTSNVKNLNIGGLVGKVESYFEADRYSADDEDDKSFATGMITATEQSATFSNDSENANVAISYTQSQSIATPNVNIGGVVGSVQAYGGTAVKNGDEILKKYVGTPYITEPMYKGVNPYQYFADDLHTISNLIVTASIVALDEIELPALANIGGIAGKSSSTLISGVTVLPSIYGHSNIGGIVGYAEHSTITYSSVEFANAGQTGLGTIAITGYTNVGGMIGYAKNANISMSYVRAYFNNRAIDNNEYYGNMALIESDLAVKNIGGLIGVIDAEPISKMLYEAIDDTDLEAAGISNYVKSRTANAVSASYFNADINTSVQTLSGKVNAGGIVGQILVDAKQAVEGSASQVTSSLIENCYVYGNIKLQDDEIITIKNKVYPKDVDGNDIKVEVGQSSPDDVIEYAPTGESTIYVVGKMKVNAENILAQYINADIASFYETTVVSTTDGTSVYTTGDYIIEITTTYTSEVSTIYDEEDGLSYNCLIQYTTFKVYGFAQKFVGSDLLYLQNRFVSDTTTNQPISDDDARTIDTNIKKEMYKLFTASTANNEIKTSYFSINNVGGYVQVDGTAPTGFQNKNLALSAINEQVKIINNSSGNIAVSTELKDNGTSPKDALLLQTNGFKIVELSETTMIDGPHDNAWAIVPELNSNYPVLFDPFMYSSILFKVLPTEIAINVIDITGFFTNASFVKDGENLVLFYNQYIDGRANTNINRYKLVTTDDTIDIEGKVYPQNAICVDLDIADLSKYGINAIVDKSMIVTSSNENVLAIENSNIMVVKSTGKVTITISSKLDTSIKDTISVLVVNGISDFNIYKTKNVTSDENVLVPIKQNNVYEDEVEEPELDPAPVPTPDPVEPNVFVDESTDNYTVGAINQVIDVDSNYFVDVINEDGPNLKDNNGSYVKNTNIGYKVDVSDIGFGTATLNTKTLEKGATYIFATLDEFVLKGIDKGLLYITITPFIKASGEFGQTLDQTATDDTFSVQNCVLLNNLTKVYKFNIIPQAERPELSRTTATLDPTGSVNLRISTITSDFNNAGGNITVNEVIYVRIVDTEQNTAVANLPLEFGNEGTNMSFINIELINTSVKTTADVLKIEYIKEISLTFNAEMYKDRTSGITFNLNNMKYRFEFYPASNKMVTGNFDLTVVPREISEIKTAYYPNSEVRMDGEFYPQEAESEYIVPSRAGMLKIELSPDYNNAEYVEVTVDEEMKQYVTFIQKVAVMATDDNSYITGYRDSDRLPTMLDNFKGVRLVNESVIVNGSSIYYTGKYYLQVVLAEDAPVNTTIKFTVTAYRTEGRNAIALEPKAELSLLVQPLPDILLTVNGQSEGYIAKGSVAELEVETINFDGEVEFSVITDRGDVTNVQKIYDPELDKHYISVGLGATAGDYVIITATVSQYLNGVLETDNSVVKLFIVEYLVEGVRVEGTTYANGRYQYETLNGTTNLMNVILDVSKHKDNEIVPSLKTNLEQEASGRIIPEGAGGYINNWWRWISGNTFETLYPNTNYDNYQFADMIMSDFSSSHFFAIKTLRVADTDVIGYKMQYYYNNLGVPKLYTGIDYGYQIFDLSFEFTLVIKDNSTYDHPNPISNEQEFRELENVGDGHYILVNDLVLDGYVPFDANFFSLDGNGYTITIKNFDTSKYKKEAGEVNVGLFQTVSKNTVLKNITIDIKEMLITTNQANALLLGAEDAGSAFIDLSDLPKFNFGLLAGKNEGSITNAKVINSLNTNMTNASSKKNVLINSTTGYIDGKPVEAKVGALVGLNNGTISNSYVGLNATNYKNETTSTELISNQGSGSTGISTYPFNFVAGKSVAGMVNTNNGIVANSYVLGTGVINTAEIFKGAQTAGFVVLNSDTGNIFNSMVEGLQTTNYRASKNHVYLEGKGYIGGFVYQNAGKISNAYSNIYITTNSGGSGGFVYINDKSGVITNAYSTVENAVNSWAHGQFTGIDDEDNYNNEGVYNSCYYLSFESEIENEDEPAQALKGRAVTENETGTGDNQFRDSGSFNGFNFASGNDTNNIWQISETSLHYGPRLISVSNQTTFSHRVLTHTSTDESTQKTQYDYEYDTTNYYGSDTNPLLVNTASDFITFIINNSKTMTFTGGASPVTLSVFGVTSSSSLATNMPHSVRLINDLDFSQIQLNNFVVDGKRLSDITFVGRLDGNGMKMNGIRLVDQNQSTIHENFGLFYQVGLTDEQLKDPHIGAESVVETAIMNIEINVLGVDSNQAVKVGTIAGSMYDTSLINITLNAVDNAFVRGPNLVGGLAGLIVNNKERLITDITTNGISVTSSHSSLKGTASTATKVDGYGKPYNGTNTKTYLNYLSYNDNKANTVENIRNLSYAGSVAGVIDAANRRDEDSAASIKTDLDASESADVDTLNSKVTINGADVSASSGSVENIKSQHRSKPINNFVSKITVRDGGYSSSTGSYTIAQNGGYVSGEHVGGLFGYVGERTHVKNSKYIVGYEKPADAGNNEDATNPVVPALQQLVGYNYCGGIVGENYGMLEQVVVEHVSSIQAKLDEAFNTSRTVTDEIENLFGETASIAVGGLAGFSAGSVITDSYSKVDVLNSNAKIAGGLVGLMAGRNYIGHSFTYANVAGSYYVGGLIGLYNQLYLQLYTEISYTDDDDATAGTEKKTTIVVQPKLLLDYVFAMNQWGEQAREMLYTNLKNYYDNSNSDFVLRMPEVGNQIIGSDLKYEKYIGSLLGGINQSDTIKIAVKPGGGAETQNDITTYSSLVSSTLKEEEVVRVDGEIKGEFGSPTAEISDVNINKAVSCGRNVAIIKGKSGSNSSNFYLFSTVISSTLNTARLTQNSIKNSGLTSLDSNYIDPMPLPADEGYAKDKISFTNKIGNQLKLSTIIGSTGDNQSLLEMFKYDTIAVGTTDYTNAGSQVWKLEKTFPEYITGIYSNFIEINSADDFRNKLAFVVSTKNQYFLLKDDVTLLNYNTNRPSVVNTTFEGTIIGVNKEGRRPRIEYTVATPKLSSIFRELNSATIMNVDFVINVSGTGSFNITNTDGASTQNNYAGLFAKVVENSVLNNCNFYVNLDNTAELLANKATDYYQGIGLAVGCLRESAMQNCSLELTVLDNAPGHNNTFAELKTTNAGSKLSVGGLVGESIRSEMQNVSVLSKNNSTIRVSSNSNTNNIGAVVGLASNSQLIDINKSLNKSILAVNTSSNLLFTTNSTNGLVNGSTLNYGGLFGSLVTTELTTAYFKGSIAYTQNSNINLRFGGIIGYTENSSAQHLNVNDFLEYDTITVTDPNTHEIISTSSEFKRTQASVLQTFTVTNNYTHNDRTAYQTSVGGVVGYVLNSKIMGNSENKLNVSNNTKIVVNVKTDKGSYTDAVVDTVNVGGIAGLVRNTGTTIELSKAYNAGKIEVNLTGTNTNSATYVGGLVGNAIGGKYAYLYNIADVVINSTHKYAIGSILGRAETNTTQQGLILTRFVNYADIYLRGEAPLSHKSGYANTRYVGGVAGIIEGAASQFNNGYTLAKVFYGSDNKQLGIANQDNGAINGIAYISKISNNTFSNVYFVYDFLPYSNFTNPEAQNNGAKVIVTTADIDAARSATSGSSTTDATVNPMIFGGIEYSKLNSMLNYAMRNTFYGATSTAVEFTTSTTDGANTIYTSTLPSKFAENGAEVEMTDISELVRGLDANNSSGNLLGKGSKLNPDIVDPFAGTKTINIDNDKHYILQNSVSGMTLKVVKPATSPIDAECFAGVLTGYDRANYITVEIADLVNNYGFISNLVVNYSYTSGDKYSGMFVTNNYGNISNCLTYGYVSGSVTYANAVSTFVLNNEGNIVQSGSVVMYTITGMTASSTFSGFVRENKSTGYIKDCYSLTTIVNSSTITSNVLTTANNVAGFVNSNAGIIETSYYAGSLKDVANVTSAFMGASTGIIRNCYYDGEANTIDGNATRGSVDNNNLTYDKSGVMFLTTDEMFKTESVAKGSTTVTEKVFYRSALKTQFVPSVWNYVYAEDDKGYIFNYSGIKSAIKLPTLFKITDDGQVSNSFVTTDNNNGTTVFMIYHPGQVNNMGQLQSSNSTNPINLLLITNIDLSKINYYDSDQGTFSSIAELNVLLHGQNHSISNLYINGNANTELGLFSKISGSIAAITKLTMVNPVVVGNNNSKAGVLAGSLVSGSVTDVTITNIDASKTAVNNNNITGAIVGEMYSGTISSITSTGLTIVGVKDVGGIVGAVRNGTVTNITINNGKVTAGSSVGGVVGLAQALPNTTSDIRIENVNVLNTEINGTNNLADQFSSIKNTTFAWKSNYNNTSTLSMLYGGSGSAVIAGGVIGWLGNGSVKNPVLTKVTINALSGLGGVAGRVDSGAEIVINKTLAATKDDLVVNGSFMVGGIAGYNEGSIYSSNISTPINAKIATDQGEGSRYNAAIGGAVGTNNNGLINGVVMGSANIYGSRLVGGIVGLNNGNSSKVESCSISVNTTIYYDSELDMDQEIGDMPDLKMGINSKDATYASNDFNTYFGLCGGDYSGRIFNADKTMGRNIIEYGGVDPKVTSNKISGKGSYKILVGFIAGAHCAGNISSCQVANNTSIQGVYDLYRIYIANVTGWKESGRPNKSWISRSIIHGIREFVIYGNSSAGFTQGQTDYKKYTNSLNTHVNSYSSYFLHQTYYYGLNRIAGVAIDAGKDIYFYLRDITTAGYYYQYLVDGYHGMYNSVYPGLTWVEGNCKMYQTDNLGEKEYHGPNKLLTAISSTHWQNINFHSGE